MNAIIQNCEGVQCCCQHSSGMHTKPEKNILTVKLEKGIRE